MAGYYVKQPENSVGPGNAAFTELVEEFPAVAWVLAGRPKGHEAGEFPPQTIMLFFDAGRLKFCLSAKHTVRVAFGTIDDPANVMASLEASLREGKFEWKDRRR